MDINIQSARYRIHDNLAMKGWTLVLQEERLLEYQVSLTQILKIQLQRSVQIVASSRPRLIMIWLHPSPLSEDTMRTFAVYSSRIWLCAMGHSAGFGYPLWAVAQDLVMRYGP
jgi:hypothetical protein